MNKSWENGEKPNFGPDFGTPKYFSLILPLLYVRHCHKLSLYAISRKTYDPTQQNGEKPHFVFDLGSLDPNSGRQNFLSKIWLFQSLDVIVSYHCVKHKKKLMI